MAVTSVKIIEELQTIGYTQLQCPSDPYIIFLPETILLKFLPSFRPKFPSDTNIKQTVSLPVLNHDSVSQEDVASDSVALGRFLRIHLDRTTSIRKDANLLIIFSGSKK